MAVVKQILSESNASEMTCVTASLQALLKTSLKTNGIPFLRYWCPWESTKVDRLKTAPIDHDTERCIEEEVNKWKLEFEPRVESLEDDVLKMKGEMSCIQGSLSENWRTQAFPELRSRLPEKLPEERLFGRTQEIKKVKELVQSGKVTVVLITGGPGFGKTTVAKEVAHDQLIIIIISQPRQRKDCYFLPPTYKEKRQ